MELRVEKLSLPKKGGGWLLHDVSFEVKKGEIFGIYGLLGAGRSELMECIMGLLLSQKAEDEDVDKVIDEIHIKVADKKLPILSLSGGNQQKVVIGKGLLTDPKILLMDEPSRGIDIGAKTEVFDIVHQFADQGLTILVVSSELKEIMNIADRIMVLSNGVKTAEFTAGEGLTEDDLVLASYAGHHTDADADAEATA